MVQGWAKVAVGWEEVGDSVVVEDSVEDSGEEGGDSEVYLRLVGGDSEANGVSNTKKGAGDAAPAAQRCSTLVSVFPKVVAGWKGGGDSVVEDSGRIRARGLSGKRTLGVEDFGGGFGSKRGGVSNT